MKYVVTLLLCFLSIVELYPQSDSFCEHNGRTFDVNNIQSRWDEWDRYKFPIIVHVLHNGESIGDYPNVSDSVIYNSINYLNQSFSGSFSNTMVDSKISFCVSEDYGIIRYNVDTIDWVGDWSVGFLDFPTNEFFFNCVDSLSIDYENNLNLFIAPFVDNTLGLSYGLYDTNYGGILIKTSELNTTILVHEFGHFMGLSHTFQGYNNCESAFNETDCYNQGDKVCDTPPTSVYGCINLGNDCYDSDTEESNTLLVNYMGYNIGCSNTFTDGQINRMQQTIEYSSRILLTSNTCSCSQEEECIYDLSGNGVVDMQDLLIILTNIFNSFDCSNGDFDSSGYVDTLDLLDLLSIMGYECE